MAKVAENLGAPLRARRLKLSMEHGPSFDLVLTRLALDPESQSGQLRK